MNNDFKEVIDEENNILRTPEEKCFPDSGGLGKLLFTYMKKNGDSVAQIDGLTGEKDLYSSYLRRCIKTAIKIRSKGITSDDIISICSFNHLNASVPFLASLFLGIKTAKLDPSLSVEEISTLLRQVRSKLIFVSTESVDLIAKSIQSAEIDTEIIVFGETSKYTPFSEYLEISEEEESFEPIEITDLQETAVILFSSGSTGLPKGVCLHHYGFLCAAYEFSQTSNRHPITVLLFSSLYWVSQVNTIILTIVNNGNRLIVPSFDKNTVWNLLTNYNIDMMFMSPSQAITWCKVDRPDEIELLSLKMLIIGGAVISEDQLKNINAVIPETIVFSAWGMTELTGRGTMFKMETLHLYDKNVLYNTVGQPTTGITYKIVDLETGKALGPNKPGELRIKSNFMMNGYFGKDSSDCFDSEGWFKTGDLMYYDENKFFYVIERIKEILQFRTHHIHPNNIESVILTHPGVQFAVVVGLPHLEDVQHPAAAVVLKDSAKEKVTPQEIEKYVEERVTDKHKLRGGVVIIEQLPLATSGKIRKRILQETLIKSTNKSGVERKNN